MVATPKAKTNGLRAKKIPHPKPKTRGAHGGKAVVGVGFQARNLTKSCPPGGNLIVKRPKCSHLNGVNPDKC